MKIVLSGVETNNKGAELMLYAILQEVERKFPKAIVYIDSNRVKQGRSYVITNLDFRLITPTKIQNFLSRLHIPGLLFKIGFFSNFLWGTTAIKDVDYFLDGSGLAFSDKMKINKWFFNIWSHKLNNYSAQGTKIIFLPQQFGPAQKEKTKALIRVIEKNANIVIPREKVSMSMLQAVKTSEKYHLFTDFTSLVEGVLPYKYEHLKNAICIIPNIQMIRKGAINYEDYIQLLQNFVMTCKQAGYVPYFLIHAGIKDKELADACNRRLSTQIEVVYGLNALEIKGLISTAYLCISSRFHGVASSLNSCVPCLATSWSYKYEELYNDYGLVDCVLNISNIGQCVTKTKEFLSEQKNTEIRNVLAGAVPIIKDETRRMWDLIWSLQDAH